MDLEEIIYKRQSCRNFKKETLSDEYFDKIHDFFKNTSHLYDDINVDYKILNTDNVKTRNIRNAPNFIALYSEEKDDYLENIGFIFQQIYVYSCKV